MVIISPVLASVPGVTHGFGTRDEPIPLDIEKLWNQTRPTWKQVHATLSCEVLGPGQQCGETDAPFTLRKNLPVAVVTADCVPILMARRSGGAVAAIHAGWRGTRARILRELWKVLVERGEKPSEWVAAVGPAIGPCCYEVSPELAEDFRHEFGGTTPSPVLPKPRMLDLPVINYAELKAIGLEDIDLLRICTKCAGLPDSAIFHSYRREGAGTRQYSMIVAT